MAVQQHGSRASDVLSIHRAWQPEALCGPAGAAGPARGACLWDRRRQLAALPMPRAALVAAAKLSALACLGSFARAQDAASTTCEHVRCTTPEHNVPPDNHLAEIADLNATRTEAECRAGGHTATGAPDDDVLWEDCACGCRAPNRVGIVGAILGFWIFYAVVTMLFVGGISVLRAPHKKAYAELKAAGKVTEDTEEMGGDSSMGWMSKTEEEVRQDVSRCRLHPHPCDQSNVAFGGRGSAGSTLPPTCCISGSALCSGLRTSARWA